jgi:hypothetical protein
MSEIKKEIRKSTGSVFLTITYDPANRWVYNDWQGLLSVENVKTGALEVLEFIKNHKSTQVLNDNRKIVGPWDSANPWIAEVWMPAAITAGLREFAHILSAGVYGKLSAEEMAVNVGDTFRMKLFDDIGEAEAFLKKHADNV